MHPLETGDSQSDWTENRGQVNLYEEFYPGDVLTQRAVSIVTAILDDGPPEAPDAPEPLAL